MSMGLLSLGLDIVVLLALGFTIYMALRLSSGLKNFRMHRDEFVGLIKELNQNIAAAERSIDGMRNASKDSGKKLGGMMQEARDLADELQLINEASNNLAKRLEGLAEKNRRNLEQDNGAASNVHSMPKKSVSTDNEQEESAGFFIRDPEFEAAKDLQDQDLWDEDDFEAEGGEFLSQAERDLYQALHKNKSH